METPRRNGYDEVWMHDPRMSFGTANKTISIVRISGGLVKFGLHSGDQHHHKFIRREKEFDKLFEFLMKL